MLVLGKRTSGSKNVGGAIVLSEQFLSSLNYYNIEYEFVDLNYRNNYGKLIAFFRINILIVWKAFKSRKIILNYSNNGVLIYLFPLLFISIFNSKKLILRFFGTNFKAFLDSQFKPVQSLIKFVVSRADLVFFEEKNQIKELQSLNKNIQWFPNVRWSPNHLSNKIGNDMFDGKFIFLGHIRKEKGVDLLLEAKLRLGDLFDLKMFGEKINYTCPPHLLPIFSKVYMGVLAQEEVIPELCKYDVLILPSYKEGYPGVIIEAFSVGLPVIASDLQGIQEMTEEHKASAILIPVDNIEELIKAILYFDKVNYPFHKQNALNAFKQFDATIQMPRIFNLINSL